jgi:hypothetical protein
MWMSVSVNRRERKVRLAVVIDARFETQDMSAQPTFE